MSQPPPTNGPQMVPPLVTMGDPQLAQPAAPVALERLGTLVFEEQAQALFEAMVHHLGIGIAAPQIGWYERLFCLMPDPEKPPQVWVNPEVVEASAAQCWAWEGCLSVPGWRGWVQRPQWVTVKGWHPSGQPLEERLEGWAARVFQHEFDHLEGILFPYRVAHPTHLVTLKAFAQREDWPKNWPAPGAALAPLGQVLNEDS